MMKSIACLVCCMVAGSLANHAQAGEISGTEKVLCALSEVHECEAALKDSNEKSGWDIDTWTIQTSLYTYHFDPDPDHVDDQNLIGIEAGFANRWLAGVAVFDNSFGQSSQLIFVGYHWPIYGSEYWYFKLMGGLLHGYKEPYEDKIPLNSLGVAPAIVPALGFKYKYFVSELNLGGLAVVTLTADVRF